MDHWLNLLIELLLIHSFRVRCPKGSKFFLGAVDKYRREKCQLDNPCYTPLYIGEQAFLNRGLLRKRNLVLEF